LAKVVGTPIFVAIKASVLMVYKMFTETAVTAVVQSINMLNPPIGSYLLTRLDTVIYLVTFAWLFLFIEWLKVAVFGKHSLTMKFIYTMAALLLVVTAQEAIVTYLGMETYDKIFSLANYMKNPIIALGFLAIPYLFILFLKPPPPIKTTHVSYGKYDLREIAHKLNLKSKIKINWDFNEVSELVTNTMQEYMNKTTSNKITSQEKAMEEYEDKLTSTIENDASTSSNRSVTNEDISKKEKNEDVKQS
jgi:hypothetical protein